MFGLLRLNPGFAVLVFCLCAALIHWVRILARAWRRRRKSEVAHRHAIYRERARRLVQKIKEIGPRENPGSVFAYLRKVNPYVFEEAVLSALADRGLKVQLNARYSGDFGIDGCFMLSGQWWLIQAKRYSGSISAEHVEAFAHLCTTQGCSGIFVSTGRTPPSAKAILQRHPHIHLVSGDRLIGLFSGERMHLGPMRPGKTSSPSPHPKTSRQPC